MNKKYNYSIKIYMGGTSFVLTRIKAENDVEARWIAVELVARRQRGCSDLYSYVIEKEKTYDD